MTVLTVVVLLAAALGVGYHAGHRAGSKAPSWRQRTRRTALGRQALTLAALVAVGQLHRSVHRRMPSFGRQRPPTHLDRLRQLARR